MPTLPIEDILKYYEKRLSFTRILGLITFIIAVVLSRASEGSSGFFLFMFSSFMFLQCAYFAIRIQRLDKKIAAQGSQS